MTNSPDLLILGAGVIGLSLADVALRNGLRVTVLDKGGIAREASWAGAGMLTCRPRLKRDAGTPDYYDLALWSVKLHAEWARRLKEETGIETGYRACGALEIQRQNPTPAEMPAELAEEETSGGGDKHTISKNNTAEWIALCAARGVPARWIDYGEVRALEPNLSGEVTGAIHFPNEAQTRNPWLVRALEASVRKRGGEIRAGVEGLTFLTDAKVGLASEPVPIGTNDSPRVLGVKTSTGEEIHAGAVAVCAGAWIGQMEFLTQRVPALKKVQPVRGQLLCYQADPTLASRLICERNHYMVPRGDGVLLVGATHEKAGFDKSTTPQGRAELERFAHGVLPALRKLEPLKTWAGLRPGMKGRHPLIGPVPGVCNLYISAGHYRNGVTLAPASAELLAAMVLGRELPFAAELWAPEPRM
ncbi:MAG TPA: FAD-dependent oxidoreductase [Planctomycetota bacterium]|nr:FAD-dependent oxidoreductase [Planctomycetota bacterium]